MQAALIPLAPVVVSSVCDAVDRVLSTLDNIYNNQAFNAVTNGLSSAVTTVFKTVEPLLFDQSTKILNLIPRQPGQDADDLMNLQKVINFLIRLRTLGFTNADMPKLTDRICQIFMNLCLHRATSDRIDRIIANLNNFAAYNPELNRICRIRDIDALETLLVAEIKSELREESATMELIRAIEHPASVDDSQDLLETLLGKGANVDKTRRIIDGDEFSLVHTAIKYHASHFLGRLIRAYADTKIHDGYGRTPLHYAIWLCLAEKVLDYTELKKIIRLLPPVEELTVRRSDLYQTMGGHNLINFVFSYALIQATFAAAGDHRGYTPLHLVACYAKDIHIELVGMVFNLADANQRERSKGKTPEELARYYKNTVIADEIGRLTQAAQAQAQQAIRPAGGAGAAAMPMPFAAGAAAQRAGNQAVVAAP